MITGREIIQMVTNADLRKKLVAKLEEFKQTKYYKGIETQLTTFANNNSLDLEAAAILALLGYVQELQNHQKQKIAFLLGFQKRVGENSPIKTLSKSTILDPNLLGLISSVIYDIDKENLAEGFDAQEILKELGDDLNENALSLWAQLCYPTARDKYGNTALMEAAYKGYTEIVETLLAKGANVNAQNEDGETALMCAALNGKTEAVRVLLNCNQVDVNAQDKYGGRTALIYTAIYRKTETLKTLLAAGAKINMDVNAQDKYGNTALMCAAYRMHTEIVETLLAKGANVNAQNEDGETALIYAAMYGYTETVKTLLAAGANVNTQDKYGNTALMLSAYRGHTETVKTLLAKGADINAKDKDGGTALIRAARHGKTETVRVLLDCKQVDVNAQNEDGRTALMEAAKYGKTETVRVLLDCKQVDVNAQDKYGNTALILAACVMHTEIAAIILEAQIRRNCQKIMEAVGNPLSFFSSSNVPNITCCGIRTNWKSAAIAAVAVGAAVGIWSLSQASSGEIDSYAIDL